ncbi:MAG: IS1634 family transposase, partial [Actinomycetota bacterium]
MKQKTLANISLLPLDTIEIIKKSLKGDIFIPASDGIEITRSRSCGHVEAVRGCLKDLGLEKIIHPNPSRQRDLIEAMVVARVIEPQTKLSTTR